jgi:hypothetical protein
MSIVRGEGVIVNVLNLGTYMPFACARSITLNLTADTIGKSTVGSGDWKEKEVVALDWNFSMEGIMYLAKPGFVDVGNFIDIWINKTPVALQFFITDVDGNEILMSGNALITALSPTGSVNNVGSLSVTGEGTGQLYSSTSFKIILVEPDTPAAGQTRLTFTFDLLPNANAYTIQINDLTAGTTIDDTAEGPPRTEIIDSTHDYAFAYRAEYTGGPGDWSPRIYYYATTAANLLSDADGALIIDSNNDNILTS